MNCSSPASCLCIPCVLCLTYSSGPFRKLSCQHFNTLTSAEGAHVIDALPTHAALPLLLERLFLEGVGLSFYRLFTHTQHTEKFDSLVRFLLSEH